MGEDWDVFFDPADFADAATWDTQGGELVDLNLVRHHMLNMLFLFVLAIFGPALFFFHDTAHLWIPENGFPIHGLPWYARMLTSFRAESQQSIRPVFCSAALFAPTQRDVRVLARCLGLGVRAGLTVV